MDAAGPWGRGPGVAAPDQVHEFLRRRDCREASLPAATSRRNGSRPCLRLCVPLRGRSAGAFGQSFHSDSACGFCGSGDVLPTSMSAIAHDGDPLLRKVQRATVTKVACAFDVSWLRTRPRFIAQAFAADRFPPEKRKDAAFGPVVPCVMSGRFCALQAVSLRHGCAANRSRQATEIIDFAAIVSSERRRRNNSPARRNHFPLLAQMSGNSRMVIKRPTRRREAPAGTTGDSQMRTTSFILAFAFIAGWSLDGWFVRPGSAGRRHLRL